MKPIPPSILGTNPSCTLCELSSSCNSVCIPTTLKHSDSNEEPQALIFFIGQNPGWKEDCEGEPFIGRSGDILKSSYIKGAHLDERALIYLGNGVRCYTLNNEAPKPTHYNACLPHLLEDMRYLFHTSHALDIPNIIITLGAPATVAFHKHILEHKKMNLNTSFGLNGKKGEWEGFGFTYFSTYHPAAVLRNNNLINTVSAHMQLVSDCIDGTMATPSNPLIVPTRSPL